MSKNKRIRGVISRHRNVATGRYLSRAAGSSHFNVPPKSPAPQPAYLETAEIMGDNDLMNAIDRGNADIEAGRVYSTEEVIKLLGL